MGAALSEQLPLVHANPRRDRGLRAYRFDEGVQPTLDLLEERPYKPSMVAVRLGFWVVRRWLEQPLGWVLALGLLATWPLLLVLTPLGVAEASVSPRTLLDLVYLAGMVGTACAVSTLGQHRGFLELLPFPSRWGGELFGLFGVALVGELLLLVGACGVPGTHWPQGTNMVALMVANLHFAALGLLLLRTSLDPAPRMAAFLGLVWVLPAWLPLNAGLHPWADPSISLQGGGISILVSHAISVGAMLMGSAWIAQATGR